MIFRIAAVLTALATFTAAEDWKVAADLDLNATQNAYSDNWTGGEVGAVSWVFNSNSSAEKQLSEKMNNKNTLKLSFGQTHAQNADTKNWEKPVKSTDLVDFESLLKFTLGSVVDPFAAARLQSQFIDVDDIILDPMTLTESAGASRTFIKKEKVDLNARAGFAVRQTIARTPDTSVTTNDGGLDFVAEYVTPLGSDDITFNSKLQVYTAFFNSNETITDASDDWKTPDINWENILSAKITKYVNVNLYTQWLYDKEIDKVGRFKQTLSLGIKYKLL